MGIVRGLPRGIAVAALLVVWAACDGSQESSSQASSSQDKGAEASSGCESHAQCPADRLCFPSGVCAPPWGSSFKIVDSSLKIGIDGLEQTHYPHCIWSQYEPAVMVQWVFSRDDWSKCESESDNVFMAAKKLDLKVGCGFSPHKEEGENATEIERGEFCLGEDCERLSIQHYRGDKPVRLTNSHGDSLEFRLLLDLP